MSLKEKIIDKSAVIGVIGLGYVGLPLVNEFIKKGYKVVGFDLDEIKIKSLHQDKSYIKHFSSEKIFHWNSTKRFNATSDFSNLSNVDVIIICVPTPLNLHKEPDLTYVMNATRTIAKYLKKEQLIVLESTTYPGTTDEDMKEILEKNGLIAGKDFYLAFSPEREDPNNKEYSTDNIPKVVGGYSKQCLELTTLLYNSIVVKTVPVSSTKTAESVKLLENIYRSVNIALVNELKILFDKMGIDIWEVIDAASTKPFGYEAFYPGPGLGGHCIPIDPFYLSWKTKKYDFNTRFIELAGEINTNMPYYVISKVAEALNQNCVSLKNSKILIIGAAYKRDVDDHRESPFFPIINMLSQNGAEVFYHDPHVAHCFGEGLYKNIKKESINLSETLLRTVDAVLVITDHSEIDYGFIEKYSKLIIDTRNVFERCNIKSDKVVKC